jgi:hypothetical protein
VGEAGGLEERYQHYKDSDVLFMNIIIEDGESNPPDQADLEEWAGEFGLTFPVLADPDSSIFWRYSSGGLPTILLIDKGVVLESVDEYALDPEIDQLLTKYE